MDWSRGMEVGVMEIPDGFWAEEGDQLGGHGVQVPHICKNHKQSTTWLGCG